MADKATAPADYEVTQSREIDGLYRNEGETVSMNPAHAKYYMSPYGAGLKVPGAKDEKPASGKATKKSG